ncbi:hypothetical protein EYF80_063874 [Liparis tanakae]|uniref:Uncharacterized protein n=1 Tax=Liparis tanakae TaxID=230148 RepID=A0A4Z2EAZ5_9TELE|nr:hypothetical protein EYF80_063874 [Liparis tanakae]
MFWYGSRKRIGSTFSDVSQLDVAIVVVGNVLRPIEGVTARSQFAINFLLIWQRAGQEGMLERRRRTEDTMKPIHQAPTQRASFGVMLTLS